MKLLRDGATQLEFGIFGCVTGHRGDAIQLDFADVVRINEALNGGSGVMRKAFAAMVCDQWMTLFLPPKVAVAPEPVRLDTGGLSHEQFIKALDQLGEDAARWRWLMKNMQAVDRVYQAPGDLQDYVDTARRADG